MANPRVKHASLFYGATGKRVATLTGCKIKIKNGSGQELADGGPYNTDGQVTSEISADNIVPITGMGVPMIQDLIDQATINLSVGLIDGKIMVFDDVRPLDVEISSEVASGKQTAAFNWQAGKPKLQ
jgi:hypothetical protein